MEKTTVYLTSEQKAALAGAADAEGRSEAWLIRTGIEVVTARHRAGETAAMLTPAPASNPEPGPTIGRPRWVDRDAFVALVLGHPADPALRAELRTLAPGTTDDEPIR